MMIKKVQIGAFGKLKDLNLDFKEGLNLVYGDNEAGKSTVQALIKAMFYGMNSQKKDIMSNARKKYIPWNSEYAYAKLYFEDDDQTTYIIERSFGNTKKEDKSLVINSVTGEKALHINEEAPGKDIFGFGEETFEKTLMINQQNYQVLRGKEDEVTQKLINLKQSGDLNLSYHKGMKKLEDLRKGITNSRKNGKLDKLVERLFQLRQEQNELIGLHEKNVEVIIELNELKDKKEQIKEHISTLENRKKVIKESADLRGLEQYDLEEHGLKEYILKEYILKEKQDYKEYIITKEIDGDITKVLSEKSKELLECEELVLEFGAFDKLEKDADTRIAAIEDEIIQLDKKIQQSKDFQSELNILKEELKRREALVEKKKFENNIYIIAVIGISSIAAISGIVLALFKNLMFYGVSITGLFFLIMGLTWLLNKGKNFKSTTSDIKFQIEEKEKNIEPFDVEEIKNKNYANREILNKIYKVCEVKSSVEFNEKLNSYKEHKEYIKILKEEMYKLKQKQSDNKLNLVFFEQRLKDYMLEEIDSEIKNYMEKLLMLEKEIQNLDNRIQNIFNKKESLSSLFNSIEEIKELSKTYEHKLNTINLTEELLKESFQELQQSFGTRLNELTGMILKEITGGKYDKVFVGDDYSIKLIEPEGKSIKDASYLSRGTYDQVYLALRLAISEIILKEKRSYPLIFDDAFIQYDKNRVINTLNYLSEFGERHQSIIFTCQSREIDHLKHINNYIKL
jgi:exonuclease SbcC